MNEADFLGVPTLQLAKSGQFGLLCAAWDLELVMPESAPRIMQEAMCQGHMDDGITHVAGLLKPTRAENGEEIAAAFHTLPGSPDSREGALTLLAKYWLQRLVAGTDVEVADVLEAADCAYATLDYPGLPFSEMCLFRDMLLWEERDRPPLVDVLRGARNFAAACLSGEP